MVNIIPKIATFLKKNSVKRFTLFFALTFIFLIFSKLSNDYKHAISLKINLTNLDEEVVMLSDSLNSLTAYIEADGFSFIPYMFNGSKDITIDAKKSALDLSEYFLLDVKKQQFLFENQLGKAYKIISIQPDTLKLYYSKRMSKVVPVVLNQDITYALGFDLRDSYKLTPDRVKIIGSEKEINKIEAINTELLQLKNVNTEIAEPVALKIPDHVEVVPKRIDVNANIVRFTEGKIDIPVAIKNIPEGVNINYFPKTVTLFYYVDLERFKSITHSDFSVECNFDSNNNLGYITPKLTKKPDFIKRAYIKQKRIDYIKL